MNQTKHKASIKAFGLRLRELRKAKDMSQEQLAWKADTELSQISRIERGIINTSLHQVFALALALEVDVKELFEFDMEE